MKPLTAILLCLLLNGCEATAYFESRPMPPQPVWLVPRDCSWDNGGVWACGHWSCPASYEVWTTALNDLGQTIPQRQATEREVRDPKLKLACEPSHERVKP